MVKGRGLGSFEQKERQPTKVRQQDSTLFYMPRRRRLSSLALSKRRWSLWGSVLPRAMALLTVLLCRHSALVILLDAHGELEGERGHLHLHVFAIAY